MHIYFVLVGRIEDSGPVGLQTSPPGPLDSARECAHQATPDQKINQSINQTID